MNDGVCNFGDKCSFAHGVSDMRAKQMMQYNPNAYVLDQSTGRYNLAPSQDEVVLKLNEQLVDNNEVITKIMNAASLIKSNQKEEAKEIIEELYKSASIQFDLAARSNYYESYEAYDQQLIEQQYQQQQYELENYGQYGESQQQNE